MKIKSDRFRRVGMPAGFKLRISPTWLTLAITLFLVLFENGSFWRSLVQAVGGLSLDNLGFVVSVFFFLVVVINLGLTLLCFKYTTKLMLVPILLGSILASYFMNKYGILIDKSMIQNVFETDSKEAFELLNPDLVKNFVLFGLVPSLVLLRSDITYKPFLKEIGSRLRVILVSVAVLGLIAVLFYKDYAVVGRNNRQLRHLINPVNYIYSVSRNVTRVMRDGKIKIQPIGEDAKLETTAAQRGKKNITILVVGETARAANFSLDGYGRETNPLLRKEDVISFENVTSCGTATATSVPCMFSVFDRSSYSSSKGKRYEGLLDVLSRSGVQVLWRDNQSGCKGVCDRVESEKMPESDLEGLCQGGECYDMVLLKDLQDYIDRLSGDAFIVLHQKGSHGPTYYLREPAKFKIFTPECGTNLLRECSDEEIVNAYDNTIVYTDYFLSQVIDFLKKNSDKNDTAMIYVSDHGESLGENNIYLHGMPYLIAPEEQKHVPFIMWMSTGFEKDHGIDRTLLRGERGNEFSHDNLFHTVLGMMGVKTKIYDVNKDILAPSRHSPSIASSAGASPPGRNKQL